MTDREHRIDTGSPEEKPCNCYVSTNIADEISCGTGKLDFNGFWEFPCTHGLAEYFERKLETK